MTELRPDDPLGGPLPGQQGQQGQQHPSPWFRSTGAPEQQQPVQQPAPEPEPEWYAPEGYAEDWYPEPDLRAPDPQTPVQTPVRDDETVALRTADTRRAAEPVVTGGRAARRKAARKGAGKGGGRHAGGAAPAPAADPEKPDDRPLTRVEARRAARAARPSAGVLASRAIGEVFISLGVLMLLFVTYQLWWSNVRAHNIAGDARSHLEEDWANGKGKPGTFEPGQGFAILHIPKLDVVVPIAEGISKPKVLDQGMVGHYDKDSIPTAMPDAKRGNFAIAGHRNTHGEPFRYINRLEPGDPIVVETRDKYYVYKMASILPQTPPSNTAVIDPVPAGSGFTKPGRYITLTTCTPEFTSTYRMIVWGKMVEERPRGKGMPDALVD
ncbi:class E sortase [Streptomyces sp. NPDC050145]|uniref:class E sortase n=1 Tax=Streptomyces sp. NPDC050145 TaxID=3365602 RepID=UPI00378962D5